MSLPKCPKCGEHALEMTKGSNWKWSQKGKGKLCPYYQVDGKIRYICACGNEWEQ